MEYEVPVAGGTRKGHLDCDRDPPSDTKPRNGWWWAPASCRSPPIGWLYSPFSTFHEYSTLPFLFPSLSYSV